VGSKKKATLRVPRAVEGWFLFNVGCSTLEKGVCHSRTGLILFGPKKLRKLSKFFENAANWIEWEKAKQPSKKE